MKKILFFCLLFVVFFAPACKRETEPTIKRVELNATVAPLAEFRVPLKEYLHDKEFPEITLPPAKFSISRIFYNDTATGPFYKFVADSTAGRTDKAIIKILREHEHTAVELEHDAEEHEANDNYTSVIITVNFSIR